MKFEFRKGEVVNIEFFIEPTCVSSRGLPERHTVRGFRSLPTSIGRVGSDGAFRIELNRPEQTFRVVGRLSPSRAAGDMRLAYGATRSLEDLIGRKEAPYICDTGPLVWAVEPRATR